MLIQWSGSAARRICPGLDFAEAILFANITHLLAVFDIALVPGNPRPARTAEGDIALDTVGAAAYVLPSPLLSLLLPPTESLGADADGVG